MEIFIIENSHKNDRTFEIQIKVRSFFRDFYGLIRITTSQGVSSIIHPHQNKSLMKGWKQ